MGKVSEYFEYHEVPNIGGYSNKVRQDFNRIIWEISIVKSVQDRLVPMGLQ